jgi:hypothetical protein
LQDAKRQEELDSNSDPEELDSRRESVRQAMKGEEDQNQRIKYPQAHHQNPRVASPRSVGINGVVDAEAKVP